MQNKKATKITLVRRKSISKNDINISLFNDDHLTQLNELLKSEDGLLRLKYEKDGFGSESYVRMSPINAKYNGKYIKIQ